MVGTLLLPLLGTPALEITGNKAAIVALVACAALAATGFGVLLGTFATTYEQVSTVGSVTIVISAALGGIMVPTFMMPVAMQTLSQFSPLAWGLDGFMHLFVRGGSWSDIVLNGILLLTFFVMALGVSWLHSTQRK